MSASGVLELKVSTMMASPAWQFYDVSLGAYFSTPRKYHPFFLTLHMAGLVWVPLKAILETQAYLKIASLWDDPRDPERTEDQNGLGWKA